MLFLQEVIQPVVAGSPTAELIRSLTDLLKEIGPVLTPLGVILIGYWTYRSKKLAHEAKTQSTANAVTLVGVQKQQTENAKAMDGKLSELLVAKSAQSMAEGEIKGRDMEQARHADMVAVPAVPPPGAAIKVEIIGGPDAPLGTIDDPVNVKPVEGKLKESADKPAKGSENAPKDKEK